MRRINQAWLKGAVDDMAPLVDLDIVMIFPGFSGRAQGRKAFLAGFREIHESTVIEAFGSRISQYMGPAKRLSSAFATGCFTNDPASDAGLPDGSYGSSRRANAAG
jgi:hypothetical protein